MYFFFNSLDLRIFGARVADPGSVCYSPRPGSRRAKQFGQHLETGGQRADRNVSKTWQNARLGPHAPAALFHCARACHAARTQTQKGMEINLSTWSNVRECNFVCRARRVSWDLRKSCGTCCSRWKGTRRRQPTSPPASEISQSGTFFIRIIGTRAL